MKYPQHTFFACLLLLSACQVPSASQIQAPTTTATEIATSSNTQQSALMHHSSPGFVLSLSPQGKGLLLAQSSKGHLPTLIPLSDFKLQKPLNLNTAFTDFKPQQTYQETLHLNPQGKGHLLRVHAERAVIQSPFGGTARQSTTLHIDTLPIQDFQVAGPASQRQLGVPYTDVMMGKALLDSNGKGYISFTGQKISAGDITPDPYARSAPAPEAHSETPSTLQRQVFFLPVDHYQIQSTLHQLPTHTTGPLIQTSTQIWLNADQEGLCIYQTAESDWFVQHIQSGEFTGDALHLGAGMAAPQLALNAQGEGQLLFARQTDTFQSTLVRYPIAAFALQAEQILPQSSPQASAYFGPDSGLLVMPARPYTLVADNWDLQVHEIQGAQSHARTLQQSLGNGWQPGQHPVVQITPEGHGLLAWQLQHPGQQTSLIRLQKIEQGRLLPPLKWAQPATSPPIPEKRT